MKGTTHIYQSGELALEHLTHELEPFSSVKSPHVQCVVFDVDDTALHWAIETDDSVKPVPMGLQLYEWCIEHLPQTKIYFITGRTESPAARQLTIQQLKSCGYHKYDALWLLPDSKDLTNTDALDLGFVIARFKWTCRKYLQIRLGYRVLFTVGDQWQDLMLGGTFMNYPIPSLSSSAMTRQDVFYLIQFDGGIEPARWCFKFPGQL